MAFPKLLSPIVESLLWIQSIDDTEQHDPLLKQSLDFVLSTRRAKPRMDKRTRKR